MDAEEAPMEKVRFSRLFQNYYLMVFLIINILICIPSNCSSFMVYLLEEINADTSLVGIVIASGYWRSPDAIGFSLAQSPIPHPHANAGLRRVLLLGNAGVPVRR